MGPVKIDHQKLPIRKKSTILGFLTPNFNTKLVIPVQSQKKNLGKNGCHLPHKIKVQRDTLAENECGTLGHFRCKMAFCPKGVAEGKSAATLFLCFNSIKG